MQESQVAAVNVLETNSRFQDVNQNPEVKLEDDLNTTRSTESKIVKFGEYSELEIKTEKEENEQMDEYGSTEQGDIKIGSEFVNTQKESVDSAQRCEEFHHSKQNFDHQPTDGNNLNCTFEGGEKRFSNQQERTLHLKEHGIENLMSEPIQTEKASNQEQRDRATSCTSNDSDTLSIDSILSNENEQMPPTSICKEELQIEMDPMASSDDEYVENTIDYHKCDDCGEEFTDTYTKNCHKIHCHLDLADLACGICKRVYSNRHSLHLHIFRVHKINVNKYKCDECDSTFFNRSNLRDHVETMHLKMYNIICHTCQMSFETKQSWEIHKKLIHPEGSQLKCEICFQLFAAEEQLTKHMQIHCQPKNVNSDKQTNESVEEIGNKTEIILPESKSNNQQRQTDGGYECSDCGKIFVCSNTLESHKSLFHTSPGSRLGFSCETCEKSFVTRYDLNLHKLYVHDPNGSKSNCDICGKSFQFIYQLHDHIDNMHLNIANYKCITCDMTFKHSPGLTSHERLHKGCKPYICIHEQCYASFSTRVEILKHEKIHKNGSYVCSNIDNCNKSFSNAQSLRLHREAYHKIFVSYCNICFEMFNDKPNLIKHMEEYHSHV